MRACGLLIIAACGGTPIGLQLAIDPGDASVDTLRIYVGMGMSDASKLRPAGVFADPAKGLSATSDPSVRYAIEPTFGDDSVHVTGPEVDVILQGDGPIEAVMIVGFANDIPRTATALFDVVLSTLGTTRTEVKLSRAAPHTTPHHMGTIDVELWGADAATDNLHQPCIGLQDDAGKDHPSAYIVDGNDPDCDGITATQGSTKLECNPDVYLGTTPPVLRQLDCLRETVVPASCRLGGPPCVDGQSPDPMACEDSVYCLPASACTICVDNGSATTNIGIGGPPALDCVASAPLAGKPITSFSCPYTYDASGNFCDKETLELFAQATSPAACVDARVRIAGGTTFNHSVFNSNGNTLQVQAGKDSMTGRCEVSFTGKNMVPTTHTGGIVGVQLDTDHGKAWPIVFEPQQGTCPTMPTKVPCTVTIATSGDLATQDTCVAALPVTPPSP